MKNSIVPAVVCCLIFAAYVTGQNQVNQKPVEPCCCQHLQQMADDLHWIREKLSKPYVPPPDIKPMQPLKDPGNISDHKIEPRKVDMPNWGKVPKPKSR